MKQTRTLIVAGFGVLLLVGCRDTSFPTAIDPAIAKVSPNVYTGWVFGPGGDPVEVHYLVINGRSIHEGDINLGPAGTVPKTREELVGRPLGKGPLYGVAIGSSGGLTRWTNGVAHFDISTEFNATQRQYILDAMAHIEATTLIDFVQQTTETSYMYFDLDLECSSPVGRVGGSQAIRLKPDFCASDPSRRMGVAAHEILHSLGMWHEQSRCDRDSYVTIHWGNIPDGEEEANYGRKCSGNADYFAYEEGSIMHYGALNPDGIRVISSTRGLDHLMGQRAALHQTDVNTINAVYQPSGVWPMWISNSGGNPLLTWNAYYGATSYSVNLVVMYEEVNGYEGYSYNWEEYGMGGHVGTTTGLSLQDTRAHTPQSECYLWDEWYGYARYSYYYDIVAILPDGALTKPQRYDAPVAPASC